MGLQDTLTMMLINYLCIYLQDGWLLFSATHNQLSFFFLIRASILFWEIIPLPLCILGGAANLDGAANLGGTANQSHQGVGI